MYDVGNLVLYGSNGVCEIIEITNRKIGKINFEYYVLKPIFFNTSTLFVPTKNEELVKKMRFVLSAEEINATLDNKDDEIIWVDNKTERFDYCKDIIAEGKFDRLINLVRSLHIHENDQKKRGKHLHISDERFLKEAERMVCDEISLVLDIDRAKVIDIIMSGYEE